MGNEKYAISIHAPAKGATFHAVDSVSVYLQFQSTLPRRERPIPHLAPVLSFRFQSTLPRRERLNTPSNRSAIRIFQSTLPRRERLLQAFRDGKFTGISIHAPAKGATEVREIKERQQEISIHAPAKGATAILAKIQLKISAKINNFFFFYTIFPLYNLLLIHKIHFICIFFWCESPGIFMSAPDSHPTSAAFKHFCHNINVSSTAIPLSTPMCSTFV